jgi:hypothetical protein
LWFCGPGVGIGVYRVIASVLWIRQSVYPFYDAGVFVDSGLVAIFG